MRHSTRIVLALFLSLAVGAGAVGAARTLWRGEIMKPDLVEKHWGHDSFQPEKFKNATPQTRAKMAFDLMRQQKRYVGKSPTEIRNELGDWDGYYFTGIFPAYLIEIAPTHDQDSWQIVFFLDRNKKVEEIAVHKNCCDR
jgi:hypothetical protein